MYYKLLEVRTEEKEKNDFKGRAEQTFFNRWDTGELVERVERFLQLVKQLVHKIVRTWFGFG